MYAPSGPPTSGINVVTQMLKLGPGIAFEPYPMTSIQSRGPKSRAGFKDAISIGANSPTSAATTMPIASGATFAADGIRSSMIPRTVRTRIAWMTISALAGTDDGSDCNATAVAPKHSRGGQLGDKRRGLSGPFAKRQTIP